MANDIFRDVLSNFRDSRVVIDISFNFIKLISSNLTTKN